MGPRLHKSALASLLLVFIVTVPLIGHAQAPAAKSNAPALISPIKCHSQLAELSKDSLSDFAAMNEDELEKIENSVGDCVNDAYLQLSRRDLRTAAFVLEWVRYAIDDQKITQLESANASFQKKYNDLLAANSSNPSSIPSPSTPVSAPASSGNRPNFIKVTISPLPSGFNKALSIGGTEYVCHAIESMEMNCAVPNAGTSSYSLYNLAAMYAKSSVWTYLIGCNPVLSSNCFTIVPGDYEAELVGADGLMISDLVTEGRPNDTPKHGIFIIYDRR